MAATASLFLGPFLLTAFSAYVSRLWNAPPFLNSEAFSAALLPLITLSAVIVILSVLAMLVFSGLIARELFRKSLTQCFPTIELGIVKKVARPQLKLQELIELRYYLHDYFILHTPTLIFIVSVVFVPDKISLHVIFVLLGIYACWSYTLAKDCLLSADGKEHIRDHRWAIPALVAVNAIHIIYLSLNVRFFMEVYRAAYVDDRNSLFGLYAAIACFFVVDFLTYIRRISALQTFFAVVVLGVFALFAVVGPGMVGATSLRALGLGGGLPASVLVKAYEVGGKEFTMVVARGCIVMNLGGQIVIEEFRSAVPSRDDCLIRHWTSAMDRNDLLKTFCRVSVYARSDIVRISSVDAHYDGAASSPSASKCDQP